MYAAGVNPVETYKRAGNMQERERERARDAHAKELVGIFRLCACVCARLRVHFRACVVRASVRVYV